MWSFCYEGHSFNNLPGTVFHQNRNESTISNPTFSLHKTFMKLNNQTKLHFCKDKIEYQSPNKAQKAWCWFPGCAVTFVCFVFASFFFSYPVLKIVLKIVMRSLFAAHVLLVLGSKYAALLAECHLLLLVSALWKWDQWAFEWLLSKLSINTCGLFVMPTLGQTVILWHRSSFVGSHTTCWLCNLLLICHTWSKHV